MRTVCQLSALLLLCCAVLPSAKAQTTRGITGTAPVTVVIEEEQKKDLRNWELTFGLGVGGYAASMRFEYLNATDVYGNYIYNGGPYYSKNSYDLAMRLGLNYYIRRDDHLSWMVSGDFAYNGYYMRRLGLAGGAEYRRALSYFWDFKAEAHLGLVRNIHKGYADKTDTHLADLSTGLAIGVVRNNRLSLKFQFSYSPTCKVKETYIHSWDNTRTVYEYTHPLWYILSVGYYLR